MIAAAMVEQQQVWLNGRLIPAGQATVSVFDHGLLYGDGVFEGIRIYDGRIFKVASHLRRLFDSARAIRLAIPYDEPTLTEAMRKTAEANERSNGYIRLCITRGVGDLGISPFVCERPTVFIIADKINLYPEELYVNGLSLVTATTIRNHPASLSPRIKSMNYLNNILASIEAMDAGVPEAVMLNHQGLVAECTGDNIFIVRCGPGESRLATPPLQAGILEGITMRAVIDLATQEGIGMDHSNLTRHDLYTANEMFLTGTAAEVVPVTRVDGCAIGNGKPGPVTKRLMGAFKALTRGNVPED